MRGRGSAGGRLWGRCSAGVRLRGMGRGNDAKTAFRDIVKMIKNHGQGQYNGKF